jgi:hypothetical protein
MVFQYTPIVWFKYALILFKSGVCMHTPFQKVCINTLFYQVCTDTQILYSKVCIRNPLIYAHVLPKYKYARIPNHA